MVGEEAEAKKNKPSCTTIQSGELYNSYGEQLTTGYDEWGYNYQAHMFNGMYPGAYRNAAWTLPYANVHLMMKWNDAWLSNKDCDGDGLLDRHYGYESYIGSGAWLTNHMWETYELNGETHTWNYFVKIVAVPEDAYLEGGFWYTVDGLEIGPEIWGPFAEILTVYNDTGSGEHGVEYKGEAPTGFGFY
jgi:hypothetical protein